LLKTITVFDGPEPSPCNVMYGLFDGTRMTPRYVPALIVMTRRVVLFAGTASIAACTVR
jgi:hypothetical protein